MMILVWFNDWLQMGWLCCGQDCMAMWWWCDGDSMIMWWWLNNNVSMDVLWFDDGLAIILLLCYNNDMIV